MVALFVNLVTIGSMPAVDPTTIAGSILVTTCCVVLRGKINKLDNNLFNRSINIATLCRTTILKYIH